MSNLKIEKRYNKSLYCDSFYLYNNNYYLEIGNKDNLNLLFHLIVNFQNGTFKNKNNLFKLNYNAKFLYITSKITNKSLGLLRNEIEDLSFLLHKEYMKEKGELL